MTTPTHKLREWFKQLTPNKESNITITQKINFKQYFWAIFCIITSIIIWGIVISIMLGIILYIAIKLIIP